MTRRHDIVGIGLAVYDTTLLVDSYPEPNTKVDATAVWHGGGGPVPNALAALSRWGVRTAYVGRVGDDIWGRALRDKFVAAGVDVSHLELDPHLPTPTASLWVDRQTGERTAVLGSSHYSAPRNVPANLIENAGALHIDGRDAEVCIEASRRARNSGVAVSMDVGSPRGGVLAVLPLVSHLVVADRFAAFASRAADPAIMLERLWLDTYEALVITHGEEGAHGRSRQGAEVRCGIYEVDVVDTTGAGDVYHAGYLFGVLNGWFLERRMRFAAAAAALAITALGARGFLPPLDEVESLVRTAIPVGGR